MREKGAKCWKGDPQSKCEGRTTFGEMFYYLPQSLPFPAVLQSLIGLFHISQSVLSQPPSNLWTSVTPGIRYLENCCLQEKRESKFVSRYGKYHVCEHVESSCKAQFI